MSITSKVIGLLKSVYGISAGANTAGKLITTKGQWRVGGTADLTGPLTNNNTTQLGILAARSGVDAGYTDLYGLEVDLTQTAGAQTQTDLYGLTFYVTAGGTGEYIYGATGIYGSAIVSTSAHCAYAIGIYGTAINAGGNPLDSATGLVGQCSTNSGTVTNAYGLTVHHVASGGSTGSRYGIYVFTPNGAAVGNITNNYGLYLEDHSGVGSALKYNLYSKGATALNHFEGRLTGAGGVTTKTKAGTPVDGDFTNPTDGLLVVDTTANKLWVRTGGLWKGVAVA